MRYILGILVLMSFTGCRNDSSEIEEPKEESSQEIVETNEVVDQYESRTETEIDEFEAIEKVVDAFWNAFQESDLDAMEECCTSDFWDEKAFKDANPLQSYSIRTIAHQRNDASAVCVIDVNEDLQVAIQLELFQTPGGWLIESMGPVADHLLDPDLRELQHPSREQAYINEVVGKIRAYGLQLDVYQLDVLDYPMTEEGLLALYQCPSNIDESIWGGPYISDLPQPDPWGQPYHYEYPGTHPPDGYDLYSSGPDLVPGTDDDIRNWE